MKIQLLLVFSFKFNKVVFSDQNFYKPYICFLTCSFCLFVYSEVNFISIRFTKFLVA